MKFKWVLTTDWNGVTSQFRIVHLVKRDKGNYSCMFVNSGGDTEKKVVREQDLFQ